MIIVYINSMSATVHKIIEEFDELSIEEKEEAKEVLDKLMIEARREEIRQNGEEAKKMHYEGKLKSFDNANDLMNSLMED